MAYPAIIFDFLDMTISKLCIQRLFEVYCATVLLWTVSVEVQETQKHYIKFSITLYNKLERN